MWLRLLVALCAVTLLGCPALRRSKEAKTSGFLGDYSLLEATTDDNQASLRYVKPGLDLSKYDKVILDPIQVWGLPDSDIAKLSKEEAQELTSYLFHALHESLAATFQMVDRPGPGTFRIRAALTEAEGSTVPLVVATTVIPQSALISGGVELATGTRGFAGVATIEAEFLDASTSDRLGAIVDRRQGAKHLGGRMFETWGDVKTACDLWAEMVGAKLREMHQGGR